MNFKDIEIDWLGNSGFRIKNSSVIYVDPYMIKDDLEKADLILITHGHYDHCSLEDINKIAKDGTVIVAPADCQSKIVRANAKVRVEIVEPGIDFSFGSVKVSTFPAYNIDKPFHDKSDNLLGYLIQVGDIIIYHAGDTDKIPEMQKITGHKQSGKEIVLLLPVGGRFTMCPEEAAEVVKEIKPNLAIPMHYGTIVGSDEDAQEFKEFCDECGVRCEILGKI